jgi:hypothetical protein
VREDLRKIAPIVVVLLFALAGASTLWSGVTSISKGVEVGWPGDRDDIYSGLEDLAFGSAFISVAYGLYRRDHRIRILAIIFSGLGLAGTLFAAITLPPRIESLSGLVLVLFVFILELFVLIWLLLPSVRKQFS